MSYIEYVIHDTDEHDPLPELARSAGFTMADLADNRKGRISNGQMARLFGRALRPVRYTGMALVGWLIFLFVVRTTVPGFVLRVAMWLATPGTSTLVAIGITVVTAGAFVLSLLQSARLIALLMVDLSAGKVAFRDGRIVLSREEQRGLGMARLWGEPRMRCGYVIGGEYFEVDEGASMAPADGRWRVYHTPRSHLMLSVEPMSVEPIPA